ncbi:hypothetical protein BsWGS_04728 [Bradybaena similaris]
MDFIRIVFLFVLITLLVDGATRPQKVLKRSKRNHVNCRPNSLVRYRMTVETFWSKQTFPKMFPTYRPHAQWSVLVGRTHGPEYKMWEEGANATLGAKLFAELGDVSQLDVESVQGYDDILDSFVAPPVNKGVGQTSAIVILDGHSSRLSFMMKIIPSPDWFVGVNSLDLCAHGRWKNKVHVDLTPFDAGTDQGLTFTAPNWPNTPQIPISAITSSFPDHPASSFLYPELKKLPRLAYLQLDIVSEYRHRETFMKVLHHYNASRTENSEFINERKAAGDELATTTVKTENRLSPFSSIFNRVAETAYKNSNENHHASADISAMFGFLGRSNTSLIKNKEENMLRINNTIENNGDEMYVHGNQKEVHKSTTRKVDTVNDTARDAELKPVFDSHFDSNSQSRSYFTTKTSEAGNNDDLPGSLGNSAVDSNKDTSKTEHVFKLDDLLRRPRKLHWKQDSTETTSEVNSILPVAPEDHRLDGSSIPKPADVDETASVDCEVREWSEWSECSQSCGFGQLERTRSVSTYPQNGGSNCPLLRETSLCGSMRNCQWTPFTFLSPNATKRQLREGRSRRPRVQTSKTLDKLH